MVKGDRRKQAIIETAERLFMERGYENATIQDVIDELKLSKGGFYHHFASKEQLLEEICEAKSTRSYEAAQTAVRECPGNAVDKLNALFDKNGIWQENDVDFLLLLIQVAYSDSNLMLREKLKKASIKKTLPLFNEIVAQGVIEGVFYSPYAETIGELLLVLGQNLTDEIAMILRNEEGPPDTVRVLERLELYRHSIEKLLDAPYGSVVILQMRRMVEICDDIWKKRQIAATIDMD